MTQSLWCPGRLPSLNQLVFTTVHARIRMQRAWVDPIAILARAAKLKPMARAFLSYAHHRPDLRGDPSNWAAGAAKVIEDGLVRAHVLPGDGFKHVAGFAHTFVVDKLRPGCLVTLESR